MDIKDFFRLSGIPKDTLSKITSDKGKNFRKPLLSISVDLCG